MDNILRGAGSEPGMQEDLREVGRNVSTMMVSMKEMNTTVKAINRERFKVKWVIFGISLAFFMGIGSGGGWSAILTLLSKF